MSKAEAIFWAEPKNLIEQLKQLKFKRPCCSWELENVSICGYHIKKEDLNESSYLLVSVADTNGNEFEVRGTSNLNPYSVARWDSQYDLGQIIILARHKISRLQVDSWHEYYLIVEEKNYGCE